MTVRHSAGSRAKPLPLLPGVSGYATYAGPRDEHRLRLDRIKGEPVFGQPFALFVGMNPSQAGAEEDDVTVRRDQAFTWGLQLSHYVKVNVGTWRSTDPRGLAAAGVMPVHPDNLAMIRELAGYADRIVLAIGAPPAVLLGPTRTVLHALKRDGRVLECFGTVKGGWPRHTSRLGHDALLEEFRP